MSRRVSPKSIKPEFTAVIKESGRWWIGWIEEVPGVNCQERTREELLDILSMRNALSARPTAIGRTWRYSSERAERRVQRRSTAASANA